MTQAALIADTIAGMKKALSRTYTSDSDNSVQKPTNRGRKLKRKAQYIHGGQLSGQITYKRKIYYAGHCRYIVSHNPKRYDFYGDELDEDDEDEEADVAVVENNPYGEVKIEHLLMPLSSAAELPNHPSLAATYKTSVLTEMAQQACEMVRKERKTLWALKQLATKFRGDQNWIPCEMLDMEEDNSLFATDPYTLALTRASGGQNMAQDDRQSVPEFLDGGFHPQKPNEDRVQIQEVFESSDRLHRVPHRPTLATSENIAVQGMNGPSVKTGSVYAEMLDLTSEVVVATARETLVRGSAMEPTEASANERDILDLGGQPAKDMSELFDAAQQPDNSTDLLPVSLPQNGIIDTTGVSQSFNEEEAQKYETPAAPRRMTTRAQAHAASEKTTSTHTRSSSPSDATSSHIHPLYLINAPALPDRDFGLLPAEAEDIRCIITLWLQKQEEVCRGAEHLYEGLSKADRMRKTVFGWCKAEGHTSEMSDGEDWYDKEEWGLDEDLKKGQLEEEDDAGNQGKKTRGRRAQ